MDFNPWGEKTDGLLFEWEDLEKMDKNMGVTYKIVESSELTQDLGLGQYKVPIVSDFFIGERNNSLSYRNFCLLISEII